MGLPEIEYRPPEQLAIIRFHTVRIKPLAPNLRDQLLQQCQADYLGALSYELAFGIHQRTGLPLMGMVDSTGFVLHAGVRDQEGRFFDARGPVEHCDMAELFPNVGAFRIREISLSDLEVAREVSPAVAKRAGHTAQLIWPELPWNDNAESRRMFDFAEQLYALCQQHGYFVGSGSDMLQIRPATGNEVAIRFDPFIAGEGAFIEFVDHE